MPLYPADDLYPADSLYPDGGSVSPVRYRGFISAISIEGPDGTDVPLMLDAYRNVSSAAGLAGIRVRELVEPNPGRHGSINRTRLRDDRPITIKQFLFDRINGDPVRVWQEYEAVSAALAAAVDTDRLLKWTRARDGISLQAQVRLTELETPVEVGPVLLVQQITLRASDPRGYSQLLQTATTTAVGAG